MALQKHAGKTVEAGTRTTDVEDIQLLADEIVALCQTSAYDDMTWAEIDHAFMRASHLLKLNFSATGSVKPPA